MKHLNDYITEKLRINKDTVIDSFNYFPKTKDELKKILEERLEKDKDADLNDIDVSKITNMSKLFMGLDPHNIDISQWNVSNVTDMRRMFDSCQNLNCDISKWDVSKVISTSMMFWQCFNFNCDLSDWNISSLRYKEDMFYGCKSLNIFPKWSKK